jgi:uncharacterized RDD family membrane protein YckC
MICRNHVDVSEGVRRCARCGATFCRDCLVEISGRPYCATCKTEQLLDVRSGVPSGGVLDLAPIGRRIGAYLLDALILWVVNTAIGFVIGLGIGLAARSGAASGAAPAAGCVSGLVGLLITIAYDAILVASTGQTLGKKAVKIKVVSETGADVTNGQAWGRAFAKMIPFALIVALFDKERRGIHDMLAHTRVVNWT